MDITNEKWAGRLLKMAKEVASWSKDESTKVGAVITTADGSPVSWGFNGMPMGIDDTIPERHVRPYKYKWMCHAERNAMDLSSRPDLSGCVMFVTFSPCTNCAQSIIQRKLRAVVIDSDHTADKMPERWQEDMLVALEMLNEAGVIVVSAAADVVSVDTQSNDV
jgi:dCMP deaminase